MKTYVYPADEFGCGYHRLIWPARQLQSEGHSVVVVMPKERNAAFRGVTDHSKKLIDVQVPPDADMIVLQRITHRHLVDAIGILREKKGITVVIDMDDDLAMVNPNNPAFTAMHPVHGYSNDHNWQFAQRACEEASYVTVSTNALLPRYAPHGRGQILYNCIPARYLDVPRVDSTVIGWAGSTHSHPDDLQVTGTALTQLTRENGPFHVVGDGVGVRTALLLDEEPVACGPQDPLEGWPAEIAKLGIGIAPLADTRFNAAKSWLKPLEYAALGVPCVASPRAEYARLHKLGVGVLARRPRQWLTALRALVTSADLRDEMSGRGRDVAANWTIEGNAWRWAEAWKNAYDGEH